jgi:hypothetical protein
METWNSSRSWILPQNTESVCKHVLWNFAFLTLLRVKTPFLNSLGGRMWMLNWLIITAYLNPLTPELNPSAQRCLTRFFTGDFASWTVHFVNICVKHQHMQQLLFQYINYVWYLLHVSALHCHPQGVFLVTSERCSIKEQSTEYCGWACCV